MLAVACSTAAPQTFHPASDNSTAASSPTSAPSAPAGPLTLVRPPFGRNAHVLMTPWMPGRPGEKAAVMAAKDFVLAVLYADYTGDRDQRWRSYAASARVRTGLAQTLHVPSVTTESFTGTVRFWRMRAVHGAKGTIVRDRVRGHRTGPQHQPVYWQDPAAWPADAAQPELLQQL